VRQDFREEDPASFSQALQSAEKQGATCVVVSVDEDPARAPQLPETARRWQLKIFSNRAHSLLVYTWQ
jgi:DNA-binding transcriptional MocR family regulator